jgi:hypothetical protein
VSLEFFVSIHRSDVLEIKASRTLSNARRTKASSWTIGGTCVEWSTNEGNIVLHSIAGEAWMVWQSAEGADAREDRVGLPNSAYGFDSGSLEQTHLGASISRESIVPKLLVRSC